jgi:hypothetical protein
MIDYLPQPEKCLSEATIDAMSVDPRLQRAKAAIRKARLHTWSNRLVRWSLPTFCLSVPLFLFAAWIAAKQSEFYGTILAIPTAAAVLLSGIAFPGSLAVRDMLVRGQLPWRFSLLQLLSLITSVSITLGMLILILKRL